MMALSLADELAGAFDSPSEGIGQSLADEFGLDQFTADEYASGSGEPDSSLPNPRSPLRTLDHNRSPRRTRPAKSSTDSDLHEQTSVSAIDEELDAALRESDAYHDVDESQLGESPSGFLAPKMEKDPIVTLQSVLASMLQFRSQLVNASSAATAQNGAPGDIGDRLQKLLDHIHESDRIREDQCREMLVLLRDGGAVNWEGIDIFEIFDDSPSSRILGLGIHGENPGWTGEPGTGIEDGWIDADPPVSPQEIQGVGNGLDPDHLMEEDFGAQRKQSDPMSQRPELPRQTLDLIRSSTDFAASLSSLTDTLHSTSSLATATSRQLRGIKAGIDSWRDRETQEDAAREGVGAWERARLTAGLGGVSTRAALDQEMEGFRGSLERAASQVDALRQRHDARRTAVAV